MGNPDENINRAVNFYEKQYRQHERDAKVGGLLAFILLLGLVTTVIGLPVAIVLAVL